VTTTTTLPAVPQVLPVAGNADVNCPTTIPTQTGSLSFVNMLMASRTCATGANPNGYDVTAFSAYIGTAAPGSNLRCSVWTAPAGYVSGTTAIPKVAAGCDSAPWASTVSPNAFVQMTVPGPCHLAPATRYFIGCNQDNTGISQAYLTPCGSNCAEQRTGTTYPGLLDPWTATSTAGGAMACYLTVTPTP
jgi:hypothetical protein